MFWPGMPGCTRTWTIVGGGAAACTGGAVTGTMRSASALATSAAVLPEPCCPRPIQFHLFPCLYNLAKTSASPRQPLRLNRASSWSESACTKRA